MFLSDVSIENFRLFNASDRRLELAFGRGLTVLAGPNDGGKTAIIDAIRLVVGTTAGDRNRIVDSDFHHDGSSQSSSLLITCRFGFDDPNESDLFLEYITPEADGPALYLTRTATRQQSAKNPIITDLRSGKSGDGPRPDATTRALLAVTYLRALRDAWHELSAGRSSRLSQILLNHPDYADQGLCDFDAASIGVDNRVELPETLVGVMRLAEHAIEKNRAVGKTRTDLNDRYLRPLSLLDDIVSGDIGITNEADLKDILERLDLWIQSAGGKKTRLNRGLGSNNILFMASELLLSRASGEDGMPLLLIEEPEAHLHPQLQLLVGEYLQAESEHDERPAPRTDETGDQAANLQVILTTHSPTLTSQVALEKIVLIIRGRAFPLRKGLRKLAELDYQYLSRFLDATRANLFFASGVLIVEGDAENILLPAIARMLDRSLTRYGVSIVRVGSTGLFRYARVFQGSSPDQDIPIPVACIADLDPKAGVALADRIARIKRYDGGPVETFVSPHRTLEYDLAFCGLGKELSQAISLAKRTKSTGEAVPENERAGVLEAANLAFATLGALPAADLAERVYEPLKSGTASKAVTAQYLAEILLDLHANGQLDSAQLRDVLPSYISEAIDYVCRQRPADPSIPAGGLSVDAAVVQKSTK